MRDFAPAPIELVRELPHFFEGGTSLDYEAGTSEVQLRQYWRLIAKYKRLIGGMTILAAVLAVIFAFTRTPLYTAETQVRISTYEPVLTATKIEDLLHERSREGNYFETQIQEIKSRSLADRVLEDPAVRAAYERRTKEGALYLFASGESRDADTGTAANGTSYKAPLALLEAYSQSLKVEPVRRTSLVNIKITLPEPGMAALVADRHAKSYIDWVKFVRVEQQSRGLKFLENQANEQRDRVAELERELAEYAEANSIVALNKDQNITVQKMAQLNELLTAAVARRIEAENSYKEAKESSGTGAGFDDSSAQSIRSELARLQAEYRQLSAKFTDNYPRMQQLRAQIEAVRGSLKGHQQDITLGMKAKAEASAMQENNLREELEKQKSLAFELSRKQVQYNILNRELTASRELLENVLRQMKETAVSVEGGASNVSIVDSAVVPAYPSYPRKKIIVILGTLLGLAIGLGAAFLLNYLDNTVRTPEDIQYLLQLPTLGVVPAFELDFQQKDAEQKEGEAKDEDGSIIPVDNGAESLPVVFHQSPKSLSSEAYRTIRTGLLLSQAGSPPHTMLFTSAQSSEGKTTTALNIAASLASSGGNVLVIDADLRRPSVLRGLSLETGTGGLVEVLTGQLDVEDVLIKGVAKGFTVLPSGRIPPNPAELLGSPQMADLIDRLTGEFDYIIIDSPPVLPVTDSMLLSRYVDGVVLVVKGKATPRKVIKDAYDRLASVGAQQLGVVLNDVDVRGGDYYYYNRYYYSYYQTGEGQSAA